MIINSCFIYIRSKQFLVWVNTALVTIRPNNRNSVVSFLLNILRVNVCRDSILPYQLGSCKLVDTKRTSALASQMPRIYTFLVMVTTLIRISHINSISLLIVLNYWLLISLPYILNFSNNTLCNLLVEFYKRCCLWHCKDKW